MFIMSIHRPTNASGKSVWSKKVTKVVRINSLGLPICIPDPQTWPRITQVILRNLIASRLCSWLGLGVVSVSTGRVLYKLKALTSLVMTLGFCWATSGSFSPTAWPFAFPESVNIKNSVRTIITHFLLCVVWDMTECRPATGKFNNSSYKLLSERFTLKPR